jgi:hypothetical protein
MMRKNVLASAESSSNDYDGFIDIDEYLSSIEQERILATAKPNSGGMVEKVDYGIRGGSPPDSTRSTPGSSQGEHNTFPNGQDFLLI